jgi:hypothetical protein
MAACCCHPPPAPQEIAALGFPGINFLDLKQPLNHQDNGSQAAYRAGERANCQVSLLAITVSAAVGG